MKWRRCRRRIGIIPVVHSEFIIIHDPSIERRRAAHAAMIAYYGAYGDCEGMGV